MMSDKDLVDNLERLVREGGVHFTFEKTADTGGFVIRARGQGGTYTFYGCPDFRVAIDQALCGILGIVEIYVHPDLPSESPDAC